MNYIAKLVAPHGVLEKKLLPRSSCCPNVISANRLLALFCLGNSFVKFAFFVAAPALLAGHSNFAFEMRVTHKKTISE